MKRKEVEELLNENGKRPGNGRKRVRTKVLAGVLTITLIGGTASYYTIRTRAADPTAQTTVQAGSDTSDDESTLSDIIRKEVNTGESSEAGKEETVYVNADSTGAAQDITVSDVLKNTDSAATIKDASNLDNIVNVKGDETYTEDADGNLTWNADGSNIYYQGTTDAELPVSVKVTYMLDGKAVTPESLVGKSGKVTIRFDYTNKETRQVVINGTTETIYVPFVAVTGMMLPNDHFSNIQVTNGKTINEGDNNIVVGYAMPGLAESLGISDDLLKDKADEITIPDYFEVTADAQDFQLGITMTGVASDVLADMDLTGSVDTDSIKNSVNTLGDSADQLVSGATELSGGLDTLNSSFGTYKSGISSLSDGILSVQSGASRLAGAYTGSDGAVNGAASVASGAKLTNSGAALINDGVNGENGLSDGTAALAQGTAYLAGQTAVLDSNVSQLSASLNDSYNNISNNITAYSTAASQLSTYQQQLNTLLTEASQKSMTQEEEAAFVSQVSQLTSAIAQCSGAQGAAAALGSVKQSMDPLTGEDGKLKELTDGTSALASGTADLNSNVSTLNEKVNGKGGLAEGVSSLAQNTPALAQGASQLSEGISQMSSGTAALVDGTGRLTTGMDALSTGTEELGSGISTLDSGSAALMDGMVTFNDEGIRKIVDVFNGDVTNLVDRINAVRDAAGTYHIFTKTADGTSSSVKFVIETSEIK